MMVNSIKFFKIEEAEKFTKTLPYLLPIKYSYIKLKYFITLRLTQTGPKADLVTSQTIVKFTAR